MLVIAGVIVLVVIIIAIFPEIVRTIIGIAYILGAIFYIIIVYSILGILLIITIFYIKNILVAAFEYFTEYTWQSLFSIVVFIAVAIPAYILYCSDKHGGFNQWMEYRKIKSRKTRTAKD